MSGRYAAAKALLQAGNLEAAEREARALLQHDPQDRAALSLLISVALVKGDHKTALTLTDDWIAREPDWAPAHQWRIRALTRASKKRQARKALKRYKADFPGDRTGYDTMSLRMESAFGSPDAVIRKIGALRREHGDRLPLDEIEAIEAVAKSQAGQLISGSHAADRVLEKNPQDATALLTKATNAFRLFRFREARHLARELRHVAPRRAAAANEIICASYAAYFPPFLVAHLFLILVYLTASRLPFIVGFYLNLLASSVLLVPIIIAIYLLAESAEIPFFQPAFYLAMVGWYFYNLLVFQRFSGRRGAAKSVQLSNNY